MDLTSLAIPPFHGDFTQVPITKNRARIPGVRGEAASGKLWVLDLEDNVLHFDLPVWGGGANGTPSDAWKVIFIRQRLYQTTQSHTSDSCSHGLSRLDVFEASIHSPSIRGGCNELRTIC